MSPIFRVISFAAGLFFLVGGGFVAFIRPYQTWQAIHNAEPIQAIVDRVELDTSQRRSTGYKYNLYVHYTEKEETIPNAYIEDSSKKYQVGDTVTIFKTHKPIGTQTSYVIKGDYQISSVIFGFLLFMFGAVLIVAAFTSTRKLLNIKTPEQEQKLKTVAKKSRLSDAALVLGMLNLTIIPIPITAPAGLVCGVLALRKLKKDPTAGTRENAWIGIVLSSISGLLAIVLIIKG